MDIQGRKLTKFPMSVLNRMGIFCLHPTSYKQNLPCIFYSAILLFCFLSTIPQYFYIKNNNIFDFVDNTEAFAAFSQIFIKLCSCAYNKQEYLQLLKHTQQFWNTDKSSKFKKSEVNGLIRAVAIFQKIVFYAFLIGTPAYMIPVYFGKKLPVGSWTMENYDIYYKILLVTQFAILPFITTFVACFDGLFLGFCYEVITQFKILSDGLENLSVINIQSQQDFNTYYQQLKSHIQYHVFLLRFIKKMQKVYSATLIIQYLSMAPMICTEMFVSSVSTDTLWKMRYGLAGICIIGQFSLYCIPISYLIEEAAIVSHGIYNSDWFSNNNRRLRVPIIMLIQASQTELQFKAWGLITININTLLTVIKVSFSTSAVFKNLRE